MTLRDYQQRAIDDLYAWLAENLGNPCSVMPTGSGKSHVIAALCKDALHNWPETRILMLTHVKELIQQNAEKMRQHWPGAPMGIYSASLNRRVLGEPITFAGIQSVRTKANRIGHVDLVIVDECHLISHKAEGGYRTLLSDLQKINPQLRVIGFTATPFRLGHGVITDEPAIFHDLLRSVSIEELLQRGFLAPLRSKHTDARLSVDGVHKRGGEYIESELQKAVDTDANNHDIVAEVIRRAEDRKAWLFFCTGVNHAEHIAGELLCHGITAGCVTGKTPRKERERILNEFKAGKIRAVTNANVLTTGFDYPDIDLIAMLRPTCSPVLYVQMAGRGMRPKSHTDHCLVLDFAGVVQTHGPITAVNAPQKPGNKDSDLVRVKRCPACDELCEPATKTCPHCGHPFTVESEDGGPQALDLRLHNDDIMGVENSEMVVTDWAWDRHVSKSSGKEMLKVTYYGEALSDPLITEYFPVTHGGYAASKAMNQLRDIALSAGSFKPLRYEYEDLLDEILVMVRNGKPPAMVAYKKNGKFYDVKSRKWSEDYAEARSPSDHEGLDTGLQ